MYFNYPMYVQYITQFNLPGVLQKVYRTNFFQFLPLILTLVLIMSSTLNFRLYIVNHVCETNEFHTVHKLQVYYSLPAEYTLCCYSTGYCLTNFHATAGSPSFTLLFDCLRMPQSLRNLLSPGKVVFLFL